jgi:uncharacterized protein
MSGALNKRSYFVVRLTLKYGSLAEARQKAPELVAAHVSRSKELHAKGILLMAGAFLDRPDEPLQTMGVLTTREACEEYLAGDPFVLRGDATHREVREWANMFAPPA